MSTLKKKRIIRKNLDKDKIKKKPNLKRDSENEYEATLIAEIARRPFLYDKTHEFFFEFQLRIDAWQEIAKHLNKSVDELKRKWERIRNTYRKCYKKMNSNLNEDECETKWIHYENLKFLDGHIKVDDTLPSEHNEIQKEFDAKLITEIVKRKHLYDPNDVSFRNKKERADTWDEISKIMNATVEMCKKRLNYLRNTFRKFNKKEMKDNKTINWVHYNSLKFLLEYESGITPPHLRPPHTYKPFKPEIPSELRNLPPLAADTSLKSENIDSNEFSDILESFCDEEEKSDLSAEIPQKCGEILITKTEIFSYKCCICDERLENVDNFTNHILENHMGRNGNVSIFEIHSISKIENDTNEDNFFDDVHNQSSSEEETEKPTKTNVLNDIGKVNNPLKPPKTDKNEISFEEEQLPILRDETEVTENQEKLEKVGKYPCGSCSFSFDKEENLKKHEESSHRKVNIVNNSGQKKESGVYSCDECDRRFQYRHDLRKHKRIHTGERPYQCTICEKKFRQYDNLKEHYIFRHTEDKPFTCRHEGCDKKFKTTRTRSAHEIIHSGDLPFQCEECGKRFPRSYDLKMHRSIWHMDKNDRPFKCPHCTKSFCTQQNLKYHVYTHTGERPYGCSVCTSKFTKPWSVKEHMKIHYGERNYVCQVCGAAFNQIAGLVRHKKRLHEGITKAT